MTTNPSFPDEDSSDPKELAMQQKAQQMVNATYLLFDRDISMSTARVFHQGFASFSREGAVRSIEDATTNNNQADTDGTTLIAEHFAALALGEGICFAYPNDAATNWLPEGYELVTNPSHRLVESDAILVYLSNDWRLIGDVRPAKIGLQAAEVGDHVRYVATLKNL
jgi:hypothetical protein